GFAIRLSWIWKLNEKSPGCSKSGVTIWLNPFVVAKDEGAPARMAIIITVRVAAIGMRDSAFFSGEHRLPACPFRQLAENSLACPESRIRNRCRRQPADNCRLAACAPQNLAFAIIARVNLFLSNLSIPC